MASKKGTGLLLLYVDIPADMEDEFNRWYNEEHLQERLSVPGFLNAARYVALSGSPKYLACYELESPAVLQSEFYLKQRDNPTEWSRRISSALALSPTTSMYGTHRTNDTTFIRNVYRQIFPAEVSPEAAQSDMAPAFQIGRMSIPPEYEDEWNDWYNTVYVPGYETVPGCIRGRRYMAVDGEPKYATVYELENDMVSRGPEWAEVRDSNPRTLQMRPHMEQAPGSPGIYRKIFQP